MLHLSVNTDDKTAYLQETLRILGCVLPDCQPAEHRPSWLVYMMRPLQTSAASVREIIFILKDFKQLYISHQVKPPHKIKYLHSEVVAQTSRSRCLDMLQPEAIRHEN